jgi:hypothetical protein
MQPGLQRTQLSKQFSITALPHKRLAHRCCRHGPILGQSTDKNRALPPGRTGTDRDSVNTATELGCLRPGTHRLVRSRPDRHDPPAQRPAAGLALSTPPRHQSRHRHQRRRGRREPCHGDGDLATGRPCREAPPRRARRAGCSRGDGPRLAAVSVAPAACRGPARCHELLGESVSDRSARQSPHRAQATRHRCYTVCCSCGPTVTFRRPQITTWSRAGVVAGTPGPVRLLPAARQVPGSEGPTSWRVTAPPAVVGGSRSSYSPLQPTSNLVARIACPGQIRCCVAGP